MPIDYQIDAEARTVYAKANGTLTDQDIFGYQCTVWSRPDVAGYNELVDMTDVEQIDQPTPDRVLDLATLSAAMDVRDTASKFAIVAPEKLAFGLGRMYETYRALDERSTKKVAVFRTRDAALKWLREQPATEESEGP